jgi:hypothetical protein
MSNSFSEEGLTATWGTVEKYSLGGLHTEFMELVWVLNGIQDHFLEILFDVFETTNIIPSNIGDFNDCLSET